MVGRQRSCSTIILTFRDSPEEELVFLAKYLALYISQFLKPDEIASCRCIGDVIYLLNLLDPERHLWVLYHVLENIDLVMAKSLGFSDAVEHLYLLRLLPVERSGSR